MKIDELIRRVGGDKVGVQVLHESITHAKQKKDGVEISFLTDCVSMQEIFTGTWENVVLVARVKLADFEAAVAASKAEQKAEDEFVFPPLPMSVVEHEKLGPMYDRLEMHLYASKCMELAKKAK